MQKGKLQKPQKPQIQVGSAFYIRSTSLPGVCTIHIQIPTVLQASNPSELDFIGRLLGLGVISRTHSRPPACPFAISLLISGLLVLTLHNVALLLKKLLSRIEGLDKLSFAKAALTSFHNYRMSR